MNWKNLGNAILIAFCLFAFISLMCFVCRLFPVVNLIVGFVGVVALIYQMMDKGDEDDNDRMSWFSGNEDEDEDEDEDKEEEE